MHGRKPQRLICFAIRTVCGIGISLKIIGLSSLQKIERLILLPLSIMPSDDSGILVCLYSCRMGPGPPMHLLREVEIVRSGQWCPDCRNKIFCFRCL